MLAARAQPAGDAVEDVAGGHRARGDRRSAGCASCSACRTRSKASSTTPRRSPRCTRSPRRASAPCPACARTGSPRAGRPLAHLLLRARALVGGQGGDDARPRPRRAAADSGRRGLPDAPRGAAPPPSTRTSRAACSPWPSSATIGTTSTTSVDPVAAIADVCAARGVWLHVDAAYAGVAAMVPELRPLFDGWERADSIVAQPAQVAVHADGSQRAVLPPDGRAARGVLARARLPQDGRGRRRRPQPDGHRHSARPPVPLAQALDGAARLRRRRPARRLPRAPAAGAPVRVVGGRRPTLRARGAGALQRGLLPAARRAGQSLRRDASTSA